jgi:hypothetical protein
MHLKPIHPCGLFAPSCWFCFRYSVRRPDARTVLDKFDASRNLALPAGCLQRRAYTGDLGSSVEAALEEAGRGRLLRRILPVSASGRCKRQHHAPSICNQPAAVIRCMCVMITA